MYLPAQSHRVASRSALKHVLDTFFQGSPEQVVEALLGKDGSGRLAEGARSYCRSRGSCQA